MKLICIFLSLILVGCGTRKESSEVHALEVRKQDIEHSKVSLQGLINEIKSWATKVAYSHSNRSLNLKAIDSTKPAKIIEKVNGEIVRETIVENGTLNESSEHSDSLMVMEISHQKSIITELRKDVAMLKEEDERQSEQIKYLERDNTKLVSGLKYAAIIAIIGLLAFLMWRLKLF